MNIPGYTAETLLSKTKTNYRTMSAHASGANGVVPQLTRLCTECSGSFFGIRRCCDMEIISCVPDKPCIVTFTNCQTENCGLFGWLVGIFAN